MIFEGQAIHDVELITLVTHGDKRGFFRKVFRIDESATESLRQISHSLVHQGILTFTKLSGITLCLIY